MDADEQLEDQIKAQVDEWSTNSNECFTIALIDGNGNETESFGPEFTYPIFGEEEAIFGYQDLEITLTFAAHNLRPHLGVSYGEKFPARGEVRPTDIHEALKDFLPDVAFSNVSAKEALRDKKASEFVPPGEKIHELVGDQKYEIWCARLSDPAAKELLENMQILMPMFIEGGSTLQLEQDWTTQRWKLFLLYAVEPKTNMAPNSSRYSLVGYGTSYRIFSLPDRFTSVETTQESSQPLESFLPPPSSTYPDDLPSTSAILKSANPLDLPSRERLSQFLILPPYHRRGLGRHLYTAMYTHLTAPSNILEFTVEDPNEAFDDLRDLSDLFYLRANDPAFAALRISTDISSAALSSPGPLPVDLIVPLAPRDTIRAKSKLMQRQFDRLVEMHTLSHIPSHHRNRSRTTKREKATNEMDKAYYLWRLYVKQRLYIFNRDQLSQVEREERIERLEATVDAVQGGYEECIERVLKREKEEGGKGVEDAAEGAKVARKGKRKVVDDDEDEDEEGGGNAINGKKMRVG